MQTLGNLVFGAALAGLTVVPSAWTDANLQVAPMSQAAAFVAGTGEVDRAMSAVRAALPLSPSRLRN